MAIKTRKEALLHVPFAPQSPFRLYPMPATVPDNKRIQLRIIQCFSLLGLWLQASFTLKHLFPSFFHFS